MLVRIPWCSAAILEYEKSGHALIEAPLLPVRQGRQACVFRTAACGQDLPGVGCIGWVGPSDVLQMSHGRGGVALSFSATYRSWSIVFHVLLLVVEACDLGMVPFL